MKIYLLVEFLEAFAIIAILATSYCFKSGNICKSSYRNPMFAEINYLKPIAHFKIIRLIIKNKKGFIYE